MYGPGRWLHRWHVGLLTITTGEHIRVIERSAAEFTTTFPGNPDQHGGPQRNRQPLTFPDQRHCIVTDRHADRMPSVGGVERCSEGTIIAVGQRDAEQANSLVTPHSTQVWPMNSKTRGHSPLH